MEPNAAALPSRSPSPTGEMYGDLERAYQTYNQELFEDALPPCLITLRARGNTFGYFCVSRFQHIDGRRADEIALNPECFATRTIEACLSTLVHEMVHGWQHVTGTAPKRPYHNKNFAEKMERIGLMTSNTGKPGGARTGQQMDHYILSGGLFLKVTRELVDAEFRARWADRFVTRAQSPEWSGWQAGSDGTETGEGLTLTLTLSDDDQNALPGISTQNPTEAMPADLVLPSVPLATLVPAAFVPPTVTASLRSKSKWTCGGCGDNAWGKPTLKLMCARCKRMLVLATEAAPLQVEGSQSHG